MTSITELMVVGVLAASCSGNAGMLRERSEMSKSENEIRQVAAREHDRREDELDVVPLSAIDLPSCRFFVVSHKTRPIHPAATYALLSSGAVVSQTNESALKEILAACDARQATPASWAELLARFHWELAPGSVLHASEPPLSAAEEKRPFAPPRFIDGPRTTLRFMLKNRETMKLYDVSAVLHGGQVLSVSKVKAE